MLPHPRNRSSVSGSAAERAGAIVLAAAFLLVLCLHAPTALASTGDPGFPRVGVWWPDTETQSAAARARYDWIALQNSDSDHIAEMRALNPDMIVLGATSGRELNYKLGRYNDPVNVELRSASTDWMLTQAGSTLSAGITSTATSVPVGDPSKFAAGEMALVNRELVYVRSVSSSSLTVTRGQVMPAAAHGSGSRIASVVSVWPGAIEFNATPSCPKTDVGRGPETWTDWNVRRGRTALQSADWDGLLIDCYDPDPSWWVKEGYCRSIDADRDNVADNLAAFNTAWNAGQTAYGNALRAAVGPDAILLPNGNLRNDSINGNNFETFPRDDTSLSTWELAVLGPYDPPHSAYLEYCTNAAAPNLTTIETYQYDDYLPDGWQTGFVPDYRKMRYGLCTALMGDGYFSFEISTEGHGTLGLYWFDEYDNAGAGKGYLGQPKGTAYLAGANLWRRDFDGGTALVNPSGAPVTVQLGASYRKIRGSQAPTVNDGSVVTSVTLAPQDGLVLLDPTSWVLDVAPPFTVSDVRTTYVSAATIHLTAVDVGSGVAATYYRLDGGPETPGTSVSTSAIGSHTLEFWSVDVAGNVEVPHQLASFAIVPPAVVDLTTPVTTSDVAPTYVSAATIHLTAVDVGSGVAATYYRLDGGPETPGTSLSTSAIGSHTLEFWSVDVAGNIESPHKLASFAVEAPSPLETAVTIRTAAAAAYLGRTVTLSGRASPDSMIGVNIVVYVMKPGKSYWSYSSNRTVYELGGLPAWQYKYYFKPGMARGYYRFKSAAPAPGFGSSSGFAASVSTQTVTIRLR